MRPGPRWLPALALLVCLGASGCSGTGHPGHPATRAGCGMVDRTALTGLLGTDVRSVGRGSLAGLRVHGTPASCTTTVPGDPARYVAVRAVHHPRPLRLPRRACDEGWVYAGSPDKYAPACQSTTRGGGGRTVLLARWGEYVVRVTIVRRDRNWGGDPEVALEMSRRIALRLGVPEAAQSASGSSS